MIYKAKLDAIPMRVYIDLVSGNTEGLEFDIPLDKAFQVLTEAYTSIVSKKHVSMELTKQDTKLNLSIKLNIIDICKVALATEHNDDAYSMLTKIGFQPKDNQSDSITNTISSAEMNIKYKVAQVRQREKTEEGEQGNTKDIDIADNFVRERVALMTNMKMYIDINVVTASEYAHMVRAMADECERMDKEMNKMKQRRK